MNILFIFIGNDDVIETKKIICILDYELIHSSPFKKLIAERKKKKQVSGNEKEAKSIIITDDRIYFSSLSTFTLKKREDVQMTND